MNTTTNYSLKKPESTDFYSVGDQNDNMDTIDTQMKANADAVAGKAAATHTHVKTDITDITFGTAASKNSPSEGNAAACEVVLGNDTRLTNAREATKLATPRNINGVAFDGSGDIDTPSKYETESQETILSASGWYRIGKFNIIHHANAMIYVCTRYNNNANCAFNIALSSAYETASFTQLSASLNAPHTLAISKIRFVHKTNSECYIEIYYSVGKANTVYARMSSMQQITNVAFTAGEIPEGYTATEFELSANPVKASTIEGILVGGIKVNSMVDGTAMTIPQLQEYLTSWDTTHVEQFAVLYIRLGFDWISKWNSHNTVDTTGWGGAWTFTKIGTQAIASGYTTTFLVSGYEDEKVYCVSWNINHWTDVKEMVTSAGGEFTGEITTLGVICKKQGTSQVNSQVYNNNNKIYMNECGGDYRGAVLDLTECANSATSKLLHTGISAPVVISATAPSDTSAVWIS